MKKVKIKIVGKKENGICEAQIPIFKEVFAETKTGDRVMGSMKKKKKKERGGESLELERVFLKQVHLCLEWRIN